MEYDRISNYLNHIGYKRRTYLGLVGLMSLGALVMGAFVGGAVLEEPNPLELTPTSTPEALLTPTPPVRVPRLLGFNYVDFSEQTPLRVVPKCEDPEKVSPPQYSAQLRQQVKNSCR